MNLDLINNCMHVNKKKKENLISSVLFVALKKMSFRQKWQVFVSFLVIPLPWGVCPQLGLDSLRVGLALPGSYTLWPLPVLLRGGGGGGVHHAIGAVWCCIYCLLLPPPLFSYSPHSPLTRHLLSHSQSPTQSSNGKNPIYTLKIFNKVQAA